MKQFLLILILTFSAGIMGQEEHHYFRAKDFSKYLWSDHYASNMRVNVGLGLNFSEYNINSNRTSRYVMYNETVAGGAIPIYNAHIGKNRWAVQTPISFSVWFDFTEERTAPILNTDYRFAPLEFSYNREVEWGFIRNFGIDFIPFFHESTHIGDELTLDRIQDSLPITRVNVSYETFEFAFRINDAMEKVKFNWSVRLGARFLWNKEKGWYSVTKYDSDTTKFIPSVRWIEPYIQYEAYYPDSYFSFGKMVFCISAEARSRVKFGYPFYYQSDIETTEITNEEDYKLSLNAMVGWRVMDSQHQFTGLGLFLRFYRGINYHGQFRNLPEYEFYGTSFIYNL